ncbi:hypothetical protein QCB44_04750 [Thiomicrorhabdus sp. zzn3]|uniref:hypothetical protein n=1 Tax=Thiomicrorhabdus sp. zzn3 TaxID=3039775 RepID=UPI0024367B71|nr:hypothetical protein [Thiomicrorhabdus sp. zzn3]MDG6778014.1 hypothetical protein [Thiomicrorhabdus sp. zzn3]
MSKAVTFWLPGLLNPQRLNEAADAFEQVSLPNLQTLLKKADRFPLMEVNGQNKRDFYATASQLFHQTGTLPVAACTAATCLTDFDASAFWIKLDPVQLIPDRDTLVLFPANELAIEESEAKALIQTFNHHFEQDRIEIEYGTPSDWFMRIRQPVDIHSHTIDQVAYQSIEGFYPSGHAAQQWRQLLNEASMLFFNHEVNEKRRLQGLPEINGLWLWGEGQLRLNEIIQRPQAVIWSENPYLQGMAKLCNSTAQPFPHTEQAWSEAGLKEWLASGDHHLFMPESLHQTLHQQTQQEWLESLQWLEKYWMTALLNMVKSGAISSLLLEVGDGYRYHLKPAHLKRFWRIRNRIKANL